ncbi:DUF4240 domain-containing protein [Hyphomicrobium facile]|uniref:DUF4240 domain-containing protein n=1 Tax=Hyphomicrobium facile TaxID=51670 RepID=A0A1I7NQ64_9HYPH|nr:DUF4240 domain-containing protein [Hyphomicrobium facile]SFV36831.1 Protein of unknown function [Hyphomicrobium facile]
MLRAVAINLAICLSIIFVPDIGTAKSLIIEIADKTSNGNGIVAMPLEEFWSLIEKVDHDSLRMGEGFDRQAVAPLALALSSHSKEDLEAFEERMAQVLYALDGRRFAEAAGMNGSSDSFLYARAYVVANGKDYYERVLRDPSLMPKSVEQWCEPLIFVARDVWRARTGRDLNYAASVSFETGSNKSQW